MERLQKVLSRAGVASRRASEKLILEGRVTVNGTPVTKLGTRVDPDHDVVRLDGRRIAAAPADLVYLMLNKPRGYVTTLADPEGRPTVRDLLRGVRARVFPVGRLDFHSEGLLLLTNDGPLARDLMHPRNRVPKTYLAKVQGRPSEDALGRLRRGILLEGARTLPARVRTVRKGRATRPAPREKAAAWLEITVIEGRKRQIRKMLERVGHPVVRLRRIRYGGIALGNLPSGRVRSLRPDEVRRLRQAIRSGERDRPGGSADSP